MTPDQQEEADLMAHARLGYNPPGSPQLARLSVRPKPILVGTIAFGPSALSRRRIWWGRAVLRRWYNLLAGLRAVGRRLHAS